MYRISITTLEKFRRYIYEVSPYDTEQSFLETLLGDFKGNEYTQIGTAFHSIIENGASVVRAGNIVMADEVNVKFNDNQIITGLQHRAKLKRAIYEVTLGKEYQTSVMPIWVGGRCDVIHGLHVRDTKTKYSPIKSLSDYTDSYQWRYYLEILGAETFYFDIFEFKNYYKKYGTDVSSLTLKEPLEIECLRYHGMDLDNLTLLNQFTEYLQRKNLINQLKLKQ